MERKGAWIASIKKGSLQGRSKKRHIAVTPIKEVDVRASREEEVRAITSKVSYTHAFTHMYTCLHVKHIHIVIKGALSNFKTSTKRMIRMKRLSTYVKRSVCLSSFLRKRK